MKKIEFARLLIFLIVPIALLSCIAENTIDAESREPVSAEVLKSEILGRWTFDGENLKSLSENSFIEFSNPNTFVLSLRGEKFVSGKFSVDNSSTISLGDLGRIDKIVLSPGNVEFTLSYDNKSVSLKGNRTTVNNSDDKTALLCRKWLMTNQEDGKDTLGGFVDRSLLTFSNSGTYLIEAYTNGNQAPAVISWNWKWHSTLSDRIVYWREGNEIEEDKKYIIIRELTQDTLKITESNVYGLRNYVFTVVN